MKKSTSLLIALIVIVIVAVGGYAIFHKSKKTNTSSSTSSSAPAVNNAVLITKNSSSLGQYLAEPNGLPLYTYGSDTMGTSNCTGSCLASWPAYQDKGATTGLPSGVGTIKRTDNGQTQYTYNGLPLYTFVNDSAGNPTGNGVSNFTLAKPAAASSSQNTPSTSSGSTNTNSNSNSSSGGGYTYPQ